MLGALKGFVVKAEMLPIWAFPPSLPGWPFLFVMSISPAE